MSDLRKFEIFARLAETTGFITREDSIQLRNSSRRVKSGRSLVQQLVEKYAIDKEMAALLWQLASRAPILEYGDSEKNITVELEKLPSSLRSEIMFAEALLRRKLVLLPKLNQALRELQQSQEFQKLSLGQILLRRRLITPEQFFELKKESENLSSENLTVKIGQHQSDQLIYLDALEQSKCLGHYELIREIARGGMGVVYEAKDPISGRVVALKTILAGEAAESVDVERFKREAEFTRELDHPHIVKVHEVGTDNGVHYFTMDYVEGVSLAEYNKTEDKLSLRKKVRLIFHIADALAYAHSRGIIHRDIKPGNILINTEKTPLLTDFGLACQQNTSNVLTLSGAALGTPTYMSVEQAQGKIREIDERSDIYSLGSVFYELLAGRPPFSGTSLAQTLHAVIHKDPVPLSQLVPGLPTNIETICMKCLEKDKKRRYPNAAALCKDLEKFLKGDTIQAKRVQPWEKMLKWTRRNPLPTAVLFFGILVVVFASVTVNTYRESLNRERSFRKETAKRLKKIALAKEELEKQLQDGKIFEGAFWHKKGEYQKSLAIYNQVIAANPHALDAYLNRAILYKELEEYDKSLADLEKAKELAPENPEVHIHMAKLCTKRDNLDQALFHYQKAIELGIEDPTIYLKLGILYVKQDQYTRAVEILSQALKLRSDLPLAYAHRGISLFHLDKYQQALEDLKKATDLGVKSSVVYNLKGIIYFRIYHKYAQALKCFNQAISINNTLEPRFNRAVLLVATKHFDKALQDLYFCRNKNPRFEEKQVAQLLQKCELQIQKQNLSEK